MGEDRATQTELQGGEVRTEPSPEDEKTWVQQHVTEPPAIIREFMGGDGISLEGKSVLDLGCGDGLIDWGIATSLRPKRLVGVDLEQTDSEELLRRLRAQGLAGTGLPNGLRFTTCTPTQLPFADNEFDWVLSWSAFEHVHDPLAATREVHRVLKPYGGFFIQVYPFFWSEHGPHLESWYPGGFVHRLRLDEIMARVSPGFAAERQLRVGQVQHSRHGNRQAGDQALWEYLNLNRVNLDDLQRALLGAGFTVSKAQLISPAVHIPLELNIRPLTDLLVAGAYLLATRSGSA